MFMRFNEGLEEKNTNSEVIFQIQSQVFQILFTNERVRLFLQESNFHTARFIRVGVYFSSTQSKRDHSVCSTRICFQILFNN